MFFSQPQALNVINSSRGLFSLAHLVPTLLSLHLTGILYLFWESSPIFEVGSYHLALQKKVFKILFSPVWNIAKHFLLPKKIQRQLSKGGWRQKAMAFLKSIWECVEKFEKAKLFLCSSAEVLDISRVFLSLLYIIEDIYLKTESLFKCSAFFFHLLKIWNPNPLLVTSQQNCYGNHYTAKVQRTVTPGRE